MRATNEYTIHTQYLFVFNTFYLIDIVWMVPEPQ